MLRKYNVKSYSELSNTNFGTGEMAVNLACVVVSKKERVSKSGNKFAFVHFSDASGMFEGVLFADAYINCKDLIDPGTAVMIKATANREEGDLRFVIQGLSKLEDTAAAVSKKLTMTVTSPKAFKDIKDVLVSSGTGSARIEMTLKCENYQSLIKVAETYKITPKTVDDLSTIPHLFDVKVA